MSSCSTWHLCAASATRLKLRDSGQGKTGYNNGASFETLPMSTKNGFTDSFLYSLIPGTRSSP